jgi:hypothetical protein
VSTWVRRGTLAPQAYEFLQPIPQSVWTISHGLGRFPVAWSLFDDNGRLCSEYEVQHLDANTCRVSMDVPTAGLLRLI